MWSMRLPLRNVSKRLIKSVAKNAPDPIQRRLSNKAHRQKGSITQEVEKSSEQIMCGAGSV